MISQAGVISDGRDFNFTIYYYNYKNIMHDNMDINMIFNKVSYNINVIFHYKRMVVMHYIIINFPFKLN